MDQPDESVLGRQEQQEVKRKFPLALVVLTFVIFPPISFILMWLDPTYHKNLKVFLFVFGVLFLIQGASTFFVVQELATVYQELEIQTPGSALVNILSSSIVFYGIFQIIFGVFYKSAIKWHVAVAALSLIFGLGIGSITIGFTLAQAILPIYNITISL